MNAQPKRAAIRLQQLDTSTARLLAVAELLEGEPELWRQADFSSYSAGPASISMRHSCGTYGCLAGWGVAMTPFEEMMEVGDDLANWFIAGMIAFDLDEDLANAIFDANFAPQGGPGPVLRALATLRVGERTLRNAMRVVSSWVGADLSGKNFDGFVFDGKTMRKTYLRNSTLEGASFVEANLEGANLIEVLASGANLSRANLMRTWLNHADLRNANLQGAELAGADLRNANLAEADLREANLTEADLREANFTNAKLNDADFTDADLTGATIDIPAAIAVGAIFTGAKLP